MTAPGIAFVAILIISIVISEFIVRMSIKSVSRRSEAKNKHGGRSVKDFPNCVQEDAKTNEVVSRLVTDYLLGHPMDDVSRCLLAYYTGRCEIYRKALRKQLEKKDKNENN